MGVPLARGAALAASYSTRLHAAPPCLTCVCGCVGVCLHVPRLALLARVRPCLVKLQGDSDSDVKYFARVGLERIESGASA